jgi:NAD(P)-dependent dehydrogenase (short-subunit alcohol dehydrogenase family)
MLEGKRALVIGAGRGIGRAIALALASRGSHVLCVSRTKEQLEQTVALAGSRAFAVAMDVTGDDAPRSLVSEALNLMGGLDILVYSGGMMLTGSVEETTPESFDELYRCNVRAPYSLSRAALPLLKRSQGEIIFINSTVIRAANLAGRGIYAATKASLKSVADSMRDEVNGDGIRVTSVAVGSTATAMQQALQEGMGRPYHPELLLQPEDIAEAVCAALTMPRSAEMTDVFIRPMRKS